MAQSAALAEQSLQPFSAIRELRGTTGGVADSLRQMASLGWVALPLSACVLSRKRGNMARSTRAAAVKDPAKQALDAIQEALNAPDKRFNARLVQDVARILAEAENDWGVTIVGPRKAGPYVPDLVALRRREEGRPLKYAIECRVSIRERWARKYFERLRNKVVGREYEEFWLVCYRRSSSPPDDLSDLRGLRLMDLEELRELLRKQARRSPPKKKVDRGPKLVEPSKRMERPSK